jgi:hypothetical protein
MLTLLNLITGAIFTITAAQADSYIITEDIHIM